MEVLDISKDFYTDNSDQFFNNEEKPKRTLSKYNFYSKIKEKNFFFNNFVKVMTHKFLDIYNNMNNTQYSIENKERPLVLIFIQERLGKLKEELDKFSKNIFKENIYDNIYQKYFTD